MPDPLRGPFVDQKFGHPGRSGAAPFDRRDRGMDHLAVIGFSTGICGLQFPGRSDPLAGRHTVETGQDRANLELLFSGIDGHRADIIGMPADLDIALFRLVISRASASE